MEDETRGKYQKGDGISCFNAKAGENAVNTINYLHSPAFTAWNHLKASLVIPAVPFHRYVHSILYSANRGLFWSEAV